MKRIPLFYLFLLLSAASVCAQTDASTAPVAWEKYKIGRHELSVDLPKMPVRIGSHDSCSNFQKHSFFSYADEAIYELTVVVKVDLPVHPACRERKLFSDNALAARLAEIRNGKPEVSESGFMLGDRQTYRFASEQNTSAQVRWVIPDMEKERWIEAAVVRRSNKKPLEESFFKSLDLTRVSGKEVGTGANSMLGDPIRATEVSGQAAARPVYDTNTVGPGIVPAADAFLILAKPKAEYTDAARRAGVQGSVRMKVTLLPNGSVGDITLVTELPKGLSEQAIAAARKLVFLPARVNGVPVSKTVTFEYGFNLY